MKRSIPGFPGLFLFFGKKLQYYILERDNSIKTWKMILSICRGTWLCFIRCNNRKALFMKLICRHYKVE